MIARDPIFLLFLFCFHFFLNFFLFLFCEGPYVSPEITIGCEIFAIIKNLQYLCEQNFLGRARQVIQIKLTEPKIEAINRSPNSDVFEAVWWLLLVRLLSITPRCQAPFTLSCQLILKAVVRTYQKQESLRKLECKGSRIFLNHIVRGNSLSTLSKTWYRFFLTKGFLHVLLTKQIPKLMREEELISLKSKLVKIL